MLLYSIGFEKVGHWRGSLENTEIWAELDHFWKQQLGEVFGSKKYCITLFNLTQNRKKISLTHIQYDLFFSEVHPAETQQRRCSNIAVISQIRHAAWSHEAFSSELCLSLQGELTEGHTASHICLITAYMFVVKSALDPAETSSCTAWQLERQLGRSSWPKPWRRSCWLICLLTGRGYPPQPPPLTLFKWLAIFYPPALPHKKGPAACKSFDVQYMRILVAVLPSVTKYHARLFSV